MVVVLSLIEHMVAKKSMNILYNIMLPVSYRPNAIQKTWFIDRHLYKQPHLVECFFHKLKQFRRIVTRYDKLASCFFAFIHIAAIAILLK